MQLLCIFFFFSAHFLACKLLREIQCKPHVVFSGGGDRAGATAANVTLHNDTNHALARLCAAAAVNACLGIEGRTQQKKKKLFRAYYVTSASERFFTPCGVPGDFKCCSGGSWSPFGPNIYVYCPQAVNQTHYRSVTPGRQPQGYYLCTAAVASVATAAAAASSSIVYNPTVSGNPTTTTVQVHRTQQQQQQLHALSTSLVIVFMIVVIIMHIETERHLLVTLSNSGSYMFRGWFRASAGG